MKSFKGLFGLLVLVGLVAAFVAGVIVFLEKKKKDEEELERYLDYTAE